MTAAAGGAGSGGRRTATVLALVSVLAAALGAAVVFLTPAQDGAAAGRQQERRRQATEPRLSRHVLELTFNPNEVRRARICKISVALQFVAAVPEQAEARIAARMEEARNELNILLSDRSVEEILGTENLRSLRRELTDRLQRLFFPEGEAELRDVLLTEIIVQ